MQLAQIASEGNRNSCEWHQTSGRRRRRIEAINSTLCYSSSIDSAQYIVAAMNSVSVQSYRSPFLSLPKQAPAYRSPPPSALPTSQDVSYTEDHFTLCEDSSETARRAQTFLLPPNHGSRLRSNESSRTPMNMSAFEASACASLKACTALTCECASVFSRIRPSSIVRLRRR